ncbi:MAG: ankyrin repeat domain-containing protein [Turneriella sp.]|nr:ankyrin repeat domain-containing protein [Turneriella sp.]
MRRMKLPTLICFAFLFACSSTQKIDETGPTADLKKAALAGNATLIEQAILAGGDPLARDERRRIPLHLAVTSGNADAVKALLQPKAVLAAKKSRREGVAILNYLNNTGSKNYGWIGASLPDAIQGSMAESFEFKRSAEKQTQKTADKVIGKKTEYTPELLEQLGEKTQAAVIISGSYTSVPGGKQAIITTQVYTPADKKLIVESQITASLDVNIFDALNQVAAEIVTRIKEYTSAEFAIRLKNSELALISDVNARDRGDLTPLAMAAAAGNTAVVEMLIKAGADYQADIMDAINFGNDAAAVSIIQAAPDINFRIAGGKTPLIQAAFKARSQPLKALLARKANSGLQDLYGFTAQLYAAQEGHAEILADLIAAGANVNIKTWDGFTAIEAARRKGRTDIVEMLGKAGAK